jgi:hypothetical protein
VVVIAEAYYPAWRARVDGREVPVFPANVLSRAVPVGSAGRHVIEMWLAPGRFLWLLPGYLVGLLGVIWAAARRRE